jgi:hypothetical protein
MHESADELTEVQRLLHAPALRWHGSATRIDHRGLAVGTRKHHLAGAPPDARRSGRHAAFVASDRASAMTGAIVNLTSGALVD